MPNTEKTVFAALLVAAAMAGSAVAQSNAPLPPAVKAAVQARLQEFAQDCRSDGGRAISPPSVSTAFLNNDDQPDLIYSFETARCSNWGAMNGYCGSLGCSVEVYLSDRGSYRRTAAISTPAWRIDRSVRPNRLIMPEGPNEPQVTWGWDGRTFTVLTRGTAAAAVSTTKAPASPAGLTDISVRLTPRAQRRMATLKEQVLVSIAIEAEPVRRTPREWYLDEITVSLGEQQVTLPAAGGVASIGVPPRLAQRTGKIRPGSEIVRIAVTSARKTQVDNILGCASVTNALASLSKAITIDCDLIG
jgi:hypothetical protein